MEKTPTMMRINFSGIKICGFVWAFCGLALTAGAQITGGQHVFRFMLLPPSARITGLGGAQIAVRDDDVAFASANPAAANQAMDGRLAINHNFFLSDIQHGNAAYAAHLPKWGFTVHGGIQYMDYGKIPQADEFGTITGEVRASEMAFTLGGARALSEKLSLGLNLRYGMSTFDVSRASALAADVGAMYADTVRKMTIALTLRNYGVQLGAYNDQREDIPYDLQLGFSKRLRYLPFRFSVIAHHLHQWDIRHNDPTIVAENSTDFEGNPIKPRGNPVIDNFFRHLIFNGEFLIGRAEAFRLRVGYNHLRKRELSVTNLRSLAGFSGGVGLKFGRFRLDMSYSAYHLAGGVFHLGLGTNLKDFF